MRRLAAIACLIGVAWGTHRAMGVAPSSSEMDEAARWAAAKFDGVAQERGAAGAGIEVVANHGAVQPNGRGGEPLRIGAKGYQHGLYCHAPSKLIVRLPRPGKVFEAEAGVDARAGGGSIVFAVKVGEKDAYRSGVMHLDTPPATVKADLGGAREFVMEVGDASDGISCDQANWAEARVTLDDGTEWRLGDQVIGGGIAPAYSVDPPFSFMYGGKPSPEAIKGWKVERTTRDADKSRVHEATWTDPATGLVVRCEATEWLDYPAVEWIVRLKNTGPTDTPLIEGLSAIDTTLPGVATDEWTLHHTAPDACTPDSYAPLTDPMPAGFRKTFASTGGRPTQGGFPYFNLARAGGGNPSALVAIGWPGQWRAEVRRDGDAVRVTGGQEGTKFKLKPGEEVRGPRVVIEFYRGDWIRGQNLWRRWMVAHNMPHVAPGAWLCTGNFYPGLMSQAGKELEFLEAVHKNGVKFDAWWQDAGWYPCDGVTWPKTGTWEVDKGRFPKGLREVSDYVHSHGMQSIVWFEPERVHPGTDLADQHPDWVHGGKSGGLLDLGNDACRQWLTDHIDHLLTTQAIDVYRQDFNIDPLDYWRKADPADRHGVTEMRHVAGYLAYWDELLKRRPGLWIDSCASGGRRNDVETLRRAVPLLRSDWYWNPEGQQCHTYGLSLWFPYQGTGAVGGRDEYWYRSSMPAGFTVGPDGSGLAGMDLPLVKRMVDEHRDMGDCFLGDFYPLTPYSPSPDVWMAWQYDRPENGSGVVQAFRRPDSIYESARLRLKGLEPAADYEVKDLGTGKVDRYQGKELMDKGLPVSLEARPGSAIVKYRRI